MFNRYGHRKYVTPAERESFIREATSAAPSTMTFCHTLAHTGGRLSEVLALRPGSFDRSAQLVVIESLKKRKKGIYRAIPIPKELIDSIFEIHDVGTNSRLWPWGRTTAWARVKSLLSLAGVPAAVCMPKALRHGFGIKGVRSGVPLNMIQKWLGHSRLATTAIYTEALGEEEIALAARMWRDSSSGPLGE